MSTIILTLAVFYNFALKFRQKTGLPYQTFSWILSLLPCKMNERANDITHYGLRLICILTGWVLANASPIGAEEITLTILHTNDTYGRLEAVSTEAGEATGGMLRRAALIRQITQDAPLSLLLDAGDAFGPHPLAKFDQAATVVDLMNQMGYTAMGIGNHELTNGIEILQQRMAQAQFPMLCANLRLRAEGKPLTPRFIIQEIGGIRVGLFGLITPTVQTRVLAKHFRPLEMLDPIQTAKDVVAELQRNGCHLVVLLSHLGYGTDFDLIGQVKGVHLIIGSEVNLPDDRTLGTMLPVEGVRATTLVYCPWRGTHLGRVDVRFTRPPDGTLQLQGMEARKYRLDEATIPEAAAREAFPEMAAQIDALIQRYQAGQTGVIGQVGQGEQISTLDLIPWILREHTGAEVALLNRGSLDPRRLEGEIQRQQIVESIRFENHVTMVEVTGAQLKAALKHSASQPALSRTLLRVGVDAAGKAVNGRPIHDAEVYSVVTNDFLAAGGDGYHALKAARRRRKMDVPLVEVVVEFLQMPAQTDEPLSASRIQQEQPRSIWKSKGQIEVTLQGSHVSDEAVSYPQISELKSQNTGTFTIGGALLHLSTLYAAPRHSLELRLDSQYRRLRHPQTPTLELADSTEAAAVFRYGPPQARFAPLVRFEVEDIEFTTDESSRVVALLGGGVESRLARNIKVSTGLVVRRTFEDEGMTQLDLDVRAQAQWQIQDIQVQSSLEWFPTFTEEGGRPLGRSIIQWKSSARLPLRKGLSLNGTLFIYRDTRLGSYASATTLALRWGTSWGKKP